MANMRVEFKIRPDDMEMDMEELKKQVFKICEDFNSDLKIISDSLEEVGFGVKNLLVKVELDEKLGCSDLEDLLNESDIVSSAQVISMDRL